MSNNWSYLLSGFIGAIGGWIIAFCINISTQHFQQRLEVSREIFQQNIEQAKLARDLNREFFRDDLYHTMRTWIPICKDLKILVKKLKTTDNCSIYYDDLNKYLGFLDDLGFYEEHNLLAIDIINQMFGQEIVETYHTNNIREYMKDARQSYNDIKVFRNFEDLAVKLINYKSGQQLSEHPLK
jgi:hypothetical protein